MPKIKSKQSIAKRFKITKKKKVMKRSTGQDHFNARETGKAKRAKRSDVTLRGKQTAANIRHLLPYN